MLCYIEVYQHAMVPWIVLTLPTSQFAYFHFAYKCLSFHLERLSRDKTGFDLLWSTTLGDLVGTREFRGQDWLEEAQLLILTDSRIRDVLSTENVEDQWQQKMVYYWEKMLCTHTLLAKCKLSWKSGIKDFVMYTWLCRQSDTKCRQWDLCTKIGKMRGDVGKVRRTWHL